MEDREQLLKKYLGYFPDENQVVECPFDPTHKERKSRLIYHIVKCPSRSPDYVCCRYNFTHVLTKEALKSHEETCPDRVKFPEITPLDYAEIAKNIPLISKGYVSKPGVLEEEVLEPEPPITKEETKQE